MYLTYYTLFQLAAIIMAVGIVPSILLRSYGWPAVQKDLEVQANSVELAREMTTHPTLAEVILYYAMTFGVVLAVYPAYMSDASLTNQDIELMFFVFGMSRFVTLLLLVTRISKYGVPALALAVLTTAVGMIISFRQGRFCRLQHQLRYSAFRLAYFTQSPSGL